MVDDVKSIFKDGSAHVASTELAYTWWTRGLVSHWTQTQKKMVVRTFTQNFDNTTVYQTSAYDFELCVVNGHEHTERRYSGTIRTSMSIAMEAPLALDQVSVRIKFDMWRVLW